MYKSKISQKQEENTGIKTVTEKNQGFTMKQTKQGPTGGFQTLGQHYKINIVNLMIPSYEEICSNEIISTI